MNTLQYSDSAIAVLADFNSVEPEFMRNVWPKASNAYMHAWIEHLGHRRAAGREIYQSPGKLLTPGML